ncbi:MAG TPA: hypothetical protein PK760_07825, partial [Flavobacteriales bacterium]|nr:hypothetical protein [Flavobacteriales bacterium]
MRLILFALHTMLCCHISAQYDVFSYRYNYAFIEDGSVLLPLQGDYAVEYLARGQWWSYMPPRTPVNHPGQRRTLKPLISVNGAPVMVVELERNYHRPDNKLRVVRGVDTMIVDLHTPGNLEERMLARTAKLGVPPRPPVLLPFRKGWFNDGDLIEEPNVVLNTARFDSLFQVQH